MNKGKRKHLMGEKKTFFSLIIHINHSILCYGGDHMKLMNIQDENKMVKMSNSLVEAKYSLGLQEQKVYLYAVSLLNEKDSSFGIIKFKLSDYAKKSKSDIKRLYKSIDGITDNLMSSFFKVKIDNDQWEKYNLMSSCKYKKGELSIKFDSEMKAFLLNLKERYTRHLLEMPIQFKNKYAIRMYQLLKANAFKTPPVVEYAYSDLKEMLGIGSKQYKAFKDFRKNVLEVAKKEIGNKSDISFEYEKITHGRKVMGLRFLITRKKDHGKEEMILENIYTKEQFEDLRKQAGLENESFTNAQIMELYEIAIMKIGNVDVCPYKYINLNYLNMMNLGNARNKFAWLKKALENDFASAVMMLGLTNEMKNE